MRTLMFMIILFVDTKCDDYYTRRAKILELESKLAFGGNITLSDQELKVNKCLMKYKFAEIDYGFQHPEYFNFSHHYFKYKDKIFDSKVYRIIKAMPKGALLHVHDAAILGPDYLLNITYMDNLHVCFGHSIKFWFSSNTPTISCDVHWQLMSNVRYAYKNITEFDSQLRKNFTVVVENPDIVYPSIKEIWIRFRKYFSTVSWLLSFKPVYKQYIYDALKALREDNIIYTEFRSSLYKLYDLNGTIYDKLFTAKVYKEAIDEFVNDHPDFYGIKLIFTHSRGTDMQSLCTYIQLAKKIDKEVPGLIVGLDLVGPENLKPLKEFVPVLNTTKDFNYFFHAGETNWFGADTDENLIDAVLLGAKRIGHAYALTKHPLVLKEVVEKDIGLEVSLVSNTVLSLVRDIRNHPLSVFLSLGLPVVLSSDDPGVWEADPLSTDFYVAFVGVANRFSDLRMLKTLAYNSLKYSALDNVNKDKAIQAFSEQWNHFVDNFNCSLFS